MQRRSQIALAAVLCFASASARAVVLAPGDLVAVLAEQALVRIDSSGSSETFFSTTGTELQTLYGVAVERSGRVLALSVGGGVRLVRVEPSTGSWEVVTPLPAIGLPFSIALDRSGARVFLVDYSGDVLRVDLAMGTVATIATLPSDGTASFALALAPDGALYVSDDAQDTLLRIDPASGAQTVVAEAVELGGFYRAHGIDVDLDGRIVGTRYDPPAILRIDPATGEQEVIAAGGLLEFPVELEVDRDGSLLVANLWAGDVVRVDLATGAQTALIDTPYLLTGLALVPHPECENGRDDDGDALRDWPLDPGCREAAAGTESPACQDGIDNDGQPGIDFDGGAAANGGVPLAAPDPDCTSAWKRERPPACGLGIESALGLVALRRRRAREGSRDLPLRMRSRGRMGTFGPGALRGGVAARRRLRRASGRPQLADRLVRAAREIAPRRFAHPSGSSRGAWDRRAPSRGRRRPGRGRRDGRGTGDSRAGAPRESQPARVRRGLGGRGAREVEPPPTRRPRLRPRRWVDAAACGPRFGVNRCRTAAHDARERRPASVTARIRGNPERRERTR